MMKREYKKPVAKVVDYSYDEQVVAASNKVDGYGDGHVIYYCTYMSDSFLTPCNLVHNSTEDFKCDQELWSLRP